MRLRIHVEGLIHISEMKDDYYVFLEKQMALVGRHSKRTFKIGQPIEVKLINVNVEQKEIDFKLEGVKDIPKSDLLEGVELPEFKPRDNNKRRFKDKDKKRSHGSKSTMVKIRKTLKVDKSLSTKMVIKIDLITLIRKVDVQDKFIDKGVR